MSKSKRIRDVIYGFIELDAQECAIIDHPAFQRLRRIRQLSLTDMVYPGATHTRFEHSIGVMQMASDMFDSIIKNSGDLLKEYLSLDEHGFALCRKTIRLAALLHDVGHAPFSHSGEGVLPIATQGLHAGQRLEHEQYSMAIIKNQFRDLIEKHPININFRISVDDVTALLGDTTVKITQKSLIWKELISGQLDADRADYLLRDSIHLGVAYGMYDRSLLVNCMACAIAETQEDENEEPVESLTLAIQEKGWHVAESLVIARYQMFTQVYFHKVRRVYDYHITCATKEVLSYMNRQNGCYPSLDHLDEYLLFDDWTICNAIKEGHGGEHGAIILGRKHYKCIYSTQLISTPEEDDHIIALVAEYKNEAHHLDDKVSTAWYKTDKDVKIYADNHVVSLREISRIVASMVEQPTQKRLYVPHALD